MTQTSCGSNVGVDGNHGDADPVADDGSDRKSGEEGCVRDDSGSGSGDDDDDKSTIPEQGRNSSLHFNYTSFILVLVFSPN